MVECIILSFFRSALFVRFSGNSSVLFDAVPNMKFRRQKHFHGTGFG